MKKTVTAAFEAKIVGKGRERDKIKIIIRLRSYPTRNRKLQKSCKKIQKIRKYNCGFISGQNRLEKRQRKRENKNYRSVSFLPDS